MDTRKKKIVTLILLCFLGAAGTIGASRLASPKALPIVVVCLIALIYAYMIYAFREFAYQKHPGPIFLIAICLQYFLYRKGMADGAIPMWARDLSAILIYAVLMIYGLVAAHQTKKRDANTDEAEV